MLSSLSMQVQAVQKAQDWAEMLYRMYNHWAERHDYKVTLLDYLDGDDAV